MDYRPIGIYSEHRPRMGGDDVRCSCGSDACIPAGRGVWVPLDTVDAAEVEAARTHLTKPDLLADMRAHVRTHGGEFVAQRDDGEVAWLYVADLSDA